MSTAEVLSSPTFRAVWDGGILPELSPWLTPEVFDEAWAKMRQRLPLHASSDDDWPWLNHPQGRSWLCHQVKHGLWQPRPLRHRFIPKSGGGSRHLGIPSLADRLVQGAVGRILAPAAEPLLLPLVHGYRPGRGSASGVRALLSQVGVQPWLEGVKADVEGLFDHLEHRRLLSAAAALCPDPLWVHLNQVWMQQWTDPSRPGRGIPQGAPLSPLLANLYLHGWVDGPMTREKGPEGCAPVGWLRYADDFVLVGNSSGSAPRLYRWLNRHVRAARLRLSPQKTRLWSAGDRSFPPLRVLGVDLELESVLGGFHLQSLPDRTFPDPSRQRNSSPAS